MDRVLTFSIEEYTNGEWIATCNEIPSITTGGMGNDITKRDSLIREAILTAAGVDISYADEILKFVGYRPASVLRSVFNREIVKEAEYVSL